jgi:hypothetical protein
MVDPIAHICISRMLGLDHSAELSQSGPAVPKYRSRLLMIPYPGFSSQV